MDLQVGGRIDRYLDSVGVQLCEPDSDDAPGERLLQRDLASRLVRPNLDCLAFFP